VNITKNGIKNYVGGNALIEMAYAHVLDKKIYLLNPVPDMNYKDEIEAMSPTILNGDLSKILTT
jgi:predicted RNA-binding protein with PUA domain